MGLEHVIEQGGTQLSKVTGIETILLGIKKKENKNQGTLKIFKVDVQRLLTYSNVVWYIIHRAPRSKKD